MDPAHLDELIRLEESYWWHVAKRRLVGGILASEFPPPGKLVEGGIGSSRNLLKFREMGYDVAGLDIMQEAVDHGRERGLSDLYRHDLSRSWPIAPGTVDAVVLLDVLEHLADPAAVLNNVQKALRPGGGAVITVPAYPWLFGDWDRRLGHYRRYTAKQLKADARAAGLRVARVTHWNAFSLPAAVAVRGYQRCFPRDRSADFPRVSPVMNRLLLACADAERRWLKRWGVPFGLSLVGVVRK